MSKREFERKVTASGVQYLAETGTGERLLVFVHGWRDSALGWQWVIDNLVVDSSWRIIAVDRHSVEGAGADSAALLEAYAAQVVDAVSEATRPDSQVVLIGQSMGAAVAELAAARLAGRLRGLVLLTPAPLAGSPMPPEVREAFELGARDLDRVNVGISRIDLAVNISADAQLRMILATPTESERSTLQTLDSWIGGHPAGQQPSLVTAPTLLVLTDDVAFPEAMLRREVAPRFDKLRVVAVQDAGHFPHLEQPEEVAKVIASFVSEL
ncbi:alpha/beta fold hydrolase [Burkholderia cepacia]|uniref:alpha/beta fold hydrolase n=1 Tax=Burkholderia cepacia TaxID=292 RepID=UPI00158DE0F4|nr:alpha/beta hydrolase [Burkholderia cepacia]